MSFLKSLKKKEQIILPETEEETLALKSTSLKQEGNFDFKAKNTHTKGSIINLTFDLEFSGKNSLETSAMFYYAAENAFNRLLKGTQCEVNMINSNAEIAYTKFQTCVISKISFKFPLALSEVKNLEKINILTNYV